MRLRLCPHLWIPAEQWSGSHFRLLHRVYQQVTGYTQMFCVNSHTFSSYPPSPISLSIFLFHLLCCQLLVFPPLFPQAFIYFASQGGVTYYLLLVLAVHRPV